MWTVWKCKHVTIMCDNAMMKPIEQEEEEQDCIWAACFYELDLLSLFLVGWSYKKKGFCKAKILLRCPNLSVPPRMGGLHSVVNNQLTESEPRYDPDIHLMPTFQKVFLLEKTHQILPQKALNKSTNKVKIHRFRK